MTLSFDDYLQHLRADGPALADVAARDLDAPVPGCPGWTTANLLKHMGEVHQWVSEIVSKNLDRPVSRGAFPPPPAGDELVEWYRSGVDRLVASFEAADPGAPAWNWSGDDLKVAWWPRRMAQETAVHRWDAQQAVGESPTGFDTAFGIDGVDELLDVILPRRTDNGPFTPDGSTLHLHATDGDGEWLLRFTGTNVEVSRGHAKGNAALRGPGGELLLFLWKRIGADAPGFEIFGDASVLGNWVEQTRL
jgi:uncharacterized protein (TIGR03083 family)